MFQFQIQSDLSESPDVVWNSVKTMKGVNREILPFLRMTYPKEAENLSLENAPLDRTLFRSWILLFGILPVDYDDIKIVEIYSHGFLESSEMLSNKIWRHKRVVSKSQNGSLVRDELEFVPRIPGIGFLFTPIYKLVFAYRHYRLRKIFGKSKK